MRLDIKRIAILALVCLLSLVLSAPAVAVKTPATNVAARPLGTRSLGVNAAVAPDDLFPGVSVPPSPIAGDLAWDTDQNDVYAIGLTPGQILSASITGAPGSNFDLYLYEPGATDWTSDCGAFAVIGPYPRTFTYTATVTGTFYFDAYAVAGSGPYSITYSIMTPDAGSDVPGVPVPASPFTGTLSDTTDPDDVFAMNLVAGQPLTVSIIGAGGTNFDLRLFRPGSSSIWGPTAAAGTTTLIYPDSFVYTPTTTGKHYLDAHAPPGGGAGAYTIAITEGVPPVATCNPTATYTGAAVVTISGTDKGGSGVRCISYSLDGAPTVVVDGSSAKVITSVLGTHTLTFTATDGSGNVSAPTTNSFAVVDIGSIVLTPSSLTPAYAGSVKLNATLKRERIIGMPIAGATVIFERLSGTSWVTIGTAMTDASGLARKATYPVSKAKTVYRARFAGVAPYLAADMSAGVAVIPKVYLTTPNAPTTMRKGKSATVSGYLKPRHAAGTYSVRIYKYRYTAGKWKPYGYVKAKTSNYTTYTKYSARVSLPLKGRWRLRAYMPVDAKHAATWSISHRNVTVK